MPKEANLTQVSPLEGLAQQKKQSKYCADPLNRHSKLQTKDLRKVSAQLISLHSSKLQKEQSLCSGCRKALKAFSPEKAQEISSSSSSLEDQESQGKESSDAEAFAEVEIESLNQSLEAIGESPFQKRKSDRLAYRAEKRRKVAKQVKRRLDLVAGSSNEPCCENCMPEVIKCLKQNFTASNDRSEQVQILTIFAGQMSIRDLVSAFNCSQRMAVLARRLYEENGIMSSPNRKQGRTLPKEIADTVVKFYRSDECSRMMPGKKDCIVVRGAEGKKTLQKRLVLMNLKELYRKLKEDYNTKIGFSKFASLRPPDCILAGASGTHSVCVCTIHQNLKLMIIGAKLKDTGFDTYKHVIAKLVCNPAQPKCYFQDCESCFQNAEMLKNELMDVFEEQAVSQVQFQQWTHTDRSELQMMTLPVQDFAEKLCDNAVKLTRHDFVAKSQANFLKQQKEELIEGQFLVIGDFSENYSFVIQDAAQGYHWNSSQATIHPWVYYYRSGEELRSGSLTVISNCNSHDVFSVHVYQGKLISHLSSRFSTVQKIIYFSDGCAAQYKNCKAFLNLCYHHHDFNIQAEWHFFATSHGKGPSDGVGGTVKREATKESLRRPYENQITQPEHLFQFAITNLPSMNFAFSTQDEYDEKKIKIQNRLLEAKTIAGTQKLHCIIPQSETTVLVREYSTSSSERKETVTRRSVAPFVGKLSGYVTVKYDHDWYLGCIIEASQESGEVTINFLHPNGPAQSFVFPHTPDQLIVDISDILLSVEPITVTGRTYTLSKQEMARSTKALSHKF